MAASKKITELDPRLQAIIDEEFSDFEKYLPSLQDIKVYQRKRREYWDNISAKIKEAALSDGRTDDTAAANN